jgi:hypothetical protein
MSFAFSKILLYTILITKGRRYRWQADGLLKDHVL